MTDPMHERFQNRLIVAMRRERLNQSELARRSGVPQSHVSRWLRGSWPTAPNLIAICMALGVSADYLLGIKPRDWTAQEETPNAIDGLCQPPTL